MGLLKSALTAKDSFERKTALWALRELCPNFPTDLTPFYDMPQYQPERARQFAVKTLKRFEKVAKKGDEI